MGLNLKIFKNNEVEQPKPNFDGSPMLFYESELAFPEIMEIKPDGWFKEEVFRILKKLDTEFYSKNIKRYYESQNSKNPDGKYTFDYIDGEGTFDSIKFERNLNIFMLESFLIWYRGEHIRELNLSMKRQDVSVVNYDEMFKKFEVNSADYGKYTMNLDRDGTEYIKNKEIPKMEILTLGEFIGKPYSEVIKHVIKTYGSTHRIPDLEDEQYILSIPSNEISEEIKKKTKDDLNYFFIGSTIYGRDGLGIPCLSGNFEEENLLPSEHEIYEKVISKDENGKESIKYVESKWEDNDRIVLIKKA